MGGFFSPERLTGFSLCPYVCFPRSDPAQQPAPGAPEGGAPGGGPPGPPPNLSSNRRLQQTQAQVEEVSSSASRPGFPKAAWTLLLPLCSSGVLDRRLLLRGWMLLSCQCQKIVNTQKYDGTPIKRLEQR